MIIARILGTVVSTQKDERLSGKKLLIVKPINLDGTDQSGYVVAVDTVGAGYHEKVIVVGGSSARRALDSVGAGVGELVFWCRGKEASFPFKRDEPPTDCTIVGIIDSDSHV